jgi:hypothetical protein
VVSGFDNQDVTDFTPVAVSSIQVIEFDTEGRVLAQFFSDDIYMDGNTFVYTTYSDEQLVGGIQLSITGRNAYGDPITNLIAVSYTNECGVYPVIFCRRCNWLDNHCKFDLYLRSYYMNIIQLYLTASL